MSSKHCECDCRPAHLPASLADASGSYALVDTGGELDEEDIRVCADIIGHARINMYVNISHAWFKMADYIRTHRSRVLTLTWKRAPGWVRGGRAPTARASHLVK